MLYVKILEKILNERDIKKSQYAQVKRVCETTIQEIKTILEDQQVSLTNRLGDDTAVDKVNNNELNEKDVVKPLEEARAPNEQEVIIVDSEKLWVPLEISCKEGDSPRIIVLALDGIQKLIAHGQLTGDYPNSENPNKRLIDRIVETICSCFTITPETDESVQLQIIKALLTIVTSQYVQIHEGSVLLTLRTCFNIYLTTTNAVNQTTSKAMLMQMLQSIFTRMEIAFEGVSHETLVQNNNNTKISPEMLDEITGTLENWEGENVGWFGGLDFSSFFFSNQVNQQNHISKCSKNNSTIQENHSNAHENELNTFQSLDDERKIQGEEITKEEIINDNKEAVLNNEVDCVEENSVTERQKPSSNSNSIACQEDEFVPDKKISNYEILQKDAFLVFWAVCKVKAQHISDIGDELSVMLETKSKKLSFQLLITVLENCGPVFQTNLMFATAVKQYLYETMMAAGISPIQEIFQLNVDLLVILADKFKFVLLEELETLFQEILFPVLENNTFPTEYKLYALGAIHRIYDNFKSLVELFMNHDCRESVEHGIFERMVTYTCKFSHPEKYITDAGPLSTLPIRHLAVESIISLLQKMTQCLDQLKDRRKTVMNCASSETVELCQQEVEYKNLSSEFVGTLMSFLENISTSVDVFEVDLMIQTIAQNLFEKWSCSGNLESADSLYVLMYSSISLVGELSSSKHQARGKATKEWFEKSNLAEPYWYTPLSTDFLHLVYTEIEAYLKQSKYRKHLNDTNVQSLNAHTLISLIGLQQPYLLHEKNARCIRKMFKIVAKSVLNALIETLFACDDTTVTDLCLSGMQHAIHITSTLNLKNERDVFVQSLSRLSLQALKEILSKTANALVVKSKTSSTTMTVNGVTKTTTTTTTETKCRNVDIIQTLLNVAIHEGNYLSSSWLDTLKCISQLEAAELMGRSSSRNNGRRPSSPGQTVDNEVKSWYQWAGSLIPSFWNNSKLDIASVKESMDTNVNRIFLNSTKLDDGAIVDFFKALCQVSLIEITHPENPRSFVYEKIFEVAHINIHRPCLQWCKIWQVLSDYFCHLACSSDEDISFFAIDSISKLVVHLLEKETFGSFRFQSQFFKSFETVLENTPFVSTRAYVLESIGKIVRNTAPKLRSGWITVFRILESSIFHDDAKTAAESFMTLANILNMFSNGEVNLRNSYGEVLRCLKDLSFKAPNKIVKMESLKMFKLIANLVHTKPELFITPDTEQLNLQRPLEVWTKGWLPIFVELSGVIIDADKYDFSDSDQASALHVVFELIKEYGDGFQETWWKSLFDILFQVFDKLKYHGDDQVIAEESIKHANTKEYSKFYCYYYVQFAIVDNFVKYYGVVGKQVLQDVLHELEWCIKQAHEQVALSGVQCLHQIIRMLHEKLSGSEWTVITHLVIGLLKSHDGSQITRESVRLLVEVELLKVLKTILIPQLDGQREMNETDTNEAESDHLHDSVGKDNQFLLLDALEERMELMSTLFSHQDENQTQMETTPNTLHLQETLIMDTHLRFMLQMYFNSSWSNDEFQKIESRFTSGVLKVLHYFVCAQPTAANRLTDLTEVMTTCIQNVHLKVPKDKFQQFSSIFYPKLCDLLELELESPLTGALAKYFLAIIRGKIENTNGDLNTLI